MILICSRSQHLSIFQCLSSIEDFANLVATIQTLKNVNPLQVNDIFSRTGTVIHGFIDATRCSRL